MMKHRLSPDDTTTNNNQAASILNKLPQRYVPLTLAILGVLVCVSLIFGMQIFHASRMNTIAVQINSLGKLNSQMRQILLTAESSADTNNPSLKLNDIKHELQQTQQLVSALENGGTFEGVAINELSDSKLENNWQSVLTIWKDYNTQFDNDEKAFNVNNPSKTLFAHLSNYARYADSKLQTHFYEINNALVQKSRGASDMSKYASLAGVILMLISFGLFIQYFVRQLHYHDQVLQNAHLEVHEILDTLTEGLFLLHDDFHISMQPSKRLKSLLPQLKEDGQDFLNLVNDLIDNTQKLSATKMFVEQLYNPRVVEKLIHSLNPLDKVEIQCPKNPNDKRIIGFQFTRIMKDNKISKVLVSVKDLTDSVRIENRLQREQEQNDLQIEMISKMLNADESIMRGFLHTSLKQLAQINAILKQPNNSAEDLAQKIRLISQEIHAFKGEASMLDMSAFRLAAESFEEMIKELRQKRQINGKDFLPLVSELDSLIEKLAQAEELHRKMTGRLNNPMPAPTAASATDLGTVLGKFVVNMGYRHNKSVIMETGGLEHLSQESANFPAVKDIIIQILRNAVVHGIEPVRARTLNGKPTEGHIKLNVLRSGNKVRISIEDDGRGIDLPALRQKAVELQLATEATVQQWSDNQLFSLIFRPNFSTLPEDETGEDGGRGMGMDLVRSRIKAINGNIGIQTQAGQYTRFTIVLPEY